MEQLIKKILLANKLETFEVGFLSKTFFSYFNDGREDYFLTLFLSYEELIQINNTSSKTEGENKKFEFLLNAIIEEIRKNHLIDYNFKNLDYNLSTILFLNLEEPADFILKELHKIEENYRVAKKYVLPYKQNDFEILKKKLLESLDIIYDLNKIAIDNNELLNNDEATWYRLLMNLFIKIPFLNYQTLTENEQLKNISNEINKNLEPFQGKILELIINEYDESQDVDIFLEQNNYFEIRDNE
jgi:hypothetical protein